MLGHASAAMTLDVYAGLFGDDLDTVADRLDATGRAAVADQSAAARGLLRTRCGLTTRRRTTMTARLGPWYRPECGYVLCPRRDSNLRHPL